MNNLEIAEKAVNLALKNGASDADAVVVQSLNLSYRQHQGKPENIESSETRDLGIRVFLSQKEGSKIALISTNNLLEKNIESTVEKVIEQAKLSPLDDSYRLANETEFYKGDDLDLQINCPNSANIDELKNWASEAEETALSYKGITNTEFSESAYSKSETTIFTSKKFAKSYFTTGYNISVSVIAGQGVDMQTDYDYTYKCNKSDLLSPKNISISACEMAIKKLFPKKIKSAKLPVIFDKKVSKNLLSNFISAINGNSIVKNSSFLSDKMGTQIFPKNVNIFDNPLMLRGIGSQPFDAEGLRGAEIPLVKNGVLENWILDLRSASKLGLISNGRASRGINTQPSPSSTNVYMNGGKINFQDMLKSVKNGFYVTDVFGMGVNGITGDYSQGANGFMIENGEITYPVAEVTIAGNLLEMFINLQIADDLELRYSKNAPTILVENMTIAGS
ncbi:MAG: TldD/PmbA family protein [Rickettsiales bacterium]|nr:TldD/PmbA family protein [Rickettsiales bacterium]